MWIPCLLCWNLHWRSLLVICWEVYTGYQECTLQINTPIWLYQCRVFSIMHMPVTGFNYWLANISNFYLKVKKSICCFSVFFASLRYFVNQEASVALPCLAVGSREQVIFFLMSEHLRDIRKWAVLFRLIALKLISAHWHLGNIKHRKICS